MHLTRDATQGRRRWRWPLLMALGLCPVWAAIALGQEPSAEELALTLTLDGLDALPTAPCEAVEALSQALEIASRARVDPRRLSIIRTQRATAKRACDRAEGKGMAAIRKGRDGADLVLVKGGRFKRGAGRASLKRGLAVCRQTYSHPEDCNTAWFDRETPLREIDLSAFYIDRFEVTNALYEACVEAGGCREIDYGSCKVYEPESGSWSSGGAGHNQLKAAQHPVVCVTWKEATDFCTWAGKRLPTEAEWEKAARGDKDDREFPWGDRWEPTFLNWGELAGFGATDGFETSAPVGAFPQNVSPFGAFDMAGNVWEWTADWRDDAYYRGSPPRDPKGGGASTERIIRGGSWSFAGNGARTSYRYFEEPDTRDDALGFRCAQSP